MCKKVEQIKMQIVLPLSIEGTNTNWLPVHIEEAALMVPQSCLYLYLLLKVIHHLQWETLDNFPLFQQKTKRHFDVGFYVPVKWAKILSLNHQNIKLCSALLTSAGIY